MNTDDQHEHMFGGGWTDEKLARLRKYLDAYRTVMSKQRDFKVCYIDAFAGTGYRTISTHHGRNDVSIFESAEENEVSIAFSDGSARIALRVEPPFDEYIFIEQDIEHYNQLIKLEQDFPDRANRMRFEAKDANEFLIRFCADKKSWIRRRAVLFLDPYGMQVRWETLQAISDTHAIDLWLLFPLGIGVNRMLCGDGKFPKGWVEKLNTFFGDDSWQKAFYAKDPQQDLFGESEEIMKVANYDTIEEYFISRLKTIFPFVENPKRLVNRQGCPLFLLIFACANQSKEVIRIAKGIASHILKN